MSSPVCVRSRRRAPAADGLDRYQAGAIRPAISSTIEPASPTRVVTRLLNGARLEQIEKLLAAESSRAQDVAERAAGNRPLTMHRHDDSVWDRRMPERVMAAPDSLDVPPLLLERPNDPRAGNRRELGAHAPTATRPRSTVGMGKPSSCMTWR